MIVTEEEAKAKWCPFSRIIAGVYTKQDPNKTTIAFAGPYNRKIDDQTEDLAVPPATRCIGSACMAWQNAGLERSFPEGTDPGDGWKMQPPYAQVDGHGPIWWTSKAGYCGLARR